MGGELAHWRNVSDVLGILVEREALRDLPYKHFAIVGGRGYDSVIEGMPISSQILTLPKPDQGSLQGKRRTSRCRERRRYDLGIGGSDPAPCLARRPG